MTHTIECWHFLPEDRRFRYGDGSIAEAGYTYSVKPPIEMCSWGLHGSARAIDALNYAPGPIIGRAVLSGEIIKGDNKSCATERTYLWIADATKELHLFACDVAEQSLTTVGNPDPRSVNAINVKRAWVAGDASDSDLDAAREAAWDAAEAWAATRAATRAAAWDAAEAAARAAAGAGAAAGAATRAAAEAGAAAGAAARAAAEEQQSQILHERLMTLEAVK